MKNYKEILYGLALFVLHLFIGVASREIWIFAITGFILSVYVTYVLCKLK